MGFAAVNPTNADLWIRLVLVFLGGVVGLVGLVKAILVRQWSPSVDEVRASQ
jgi:hypothetical protein